MNVGVPLEDNVNVCLQ